MTEHVTERARLAAIAGAIIGIQVGLSLVATRYVAAETGPFSLALLRYIAGSIVLFPIAMFLTRNDRRERWTHREWALIVGLGIVQFGLQIAALNEGLKTVVAARSALIYCTTPFMALAIGAALGRERLTAPKVAGVLLTIVGVAFALGEKIFEVKAGASGWSGEFLCFVAAVLSAACSVFYRATLGHLSALAVGAWAMLLSCFCLAPIAAMEGFFTHPPAFSPWGWGAIVFLGCASALGYFLWLWALQNTTPTRLTAFLALSPIAAGLFGVALLGEPISLGIVLGGLLIFLGLYVAHRDPLRLPRGTR